jgi:hypothetical protein
MRKAESLRRSRSPAHSKEVRPTQWPTPVVGANSSRRGQRQVQVNGSRRCGIAKFPIPHSHFLPLVVCHLAADQRDELGVGFEAAQLLGQLFHRLDMMHRGEGSPEHGDRMERFRREE